MSQRLTRKEMKRDEVAEALGRTVEYAGSHVRTLVLAGVAVVVLVLAGAGAWFWLQGRSARTNEALTAAVRVYNAPVVADGATPDDPDSPSFASEEARRQRAKELLEEARGGYGGAADTALVYLGQIAVDEGNLGEAKELWERFVEANEGHVLAGGVRVSLLEIERVEGRAEEVAGRLETMLDQTPENRPLPGDVILFQLGLTYEALGRDEDAGDMFRRLGEEYPRSAYGAEARQKLGPAAAGALAGLG